MKLKPTFIDVETFWSKTHTLSKMSPLEYVMHPDTEIQMFACKFGRKANTDVIVGEASIQNAVSKIDWSDKFVIAHNMSGFDALVLAWRLGIRPAMWGCTLAMARPIHAKTTGLSLAKLVQHYGIGTKNQQALIDTCGKRLADFTADELRRMETYNGDDTDQCAELFYKLVPHYTTAELWHIDAKIRALVEPKFELDMPLLRETLAQERQSKREDLMELADLMEVDGVDEEARAEAVRAQLASSAKFAELLTSLGAEVPMKESNTVAGKMIPAVSKTDEGMKELLDSPSHLVAAAARGRLAVKSTILETRLEAFVQAGEVTGGKWPVTAHYCGADTTGRPSGWLYNPLNLPRVNPKSPKRADALRNSIRAPKDHVVVVSDSSGIELRFNHFLWMVPYSTQLWSQKADADLYRASASRMYNVPPEEVTGDQRQFHKVLNLACLGPDTRVVTDSGVKALVDVRISDLVWDGESWVKHSGLVDRGVREVETAYGLTATADHKVQTEDGWREWREVHTSPYLFQSALSSATSPWSSGGKYCAMEHRTDTTQLFVAPVDGSAESIGTTSSTDGRPGAEPVGVELESPQSSAVPDTPTSSLTMRTADGCLIGCQPASPDATGLALTRTMADGGSSSTSLGSPTGLLSCDTSPACLDGTTPRSTSIASTTTGGMSLATYGSAHAPSTQETAGRSQTSLHESSNSKRSSQTYDLSFCGPNNRFTVLTDAGPILVHNCGYGMGVPKFRTTARNAPGGKDIPVLVRMPDGSEVEVFGDRDISEVLARTDVELVFDEAREGVYGWRKVNKEIVDGWQRCGEVLEYIAGGREVEIDPWGMFVTCAEGIRMPSGRLIRYPDLRLERDEKTNKPQWVYGQGRHMARLYGGKVDENLVQAGARDVIYDIALNVYRASGFRYSHEVYDELCYVVPKSVAEDFLKLLQDEMRKPTEWFPALIKWSEGDIADCYGSAK